MNREQGKEWLEARGFVAYRNGWRNQYGIRFEHSRVEGYDWWRVYIGDGCEKSSGGLSPSDALDSLLREMTTNLRRLERDREQIVGILVKQD